MATDVADSARMIREILSGAPGPRTELVVLNAAAALVISGIAPDMLSGVARARAALSDGRAAATLSSLVRASKAS